MTNEEFAALGNGDIVRGKFSGIPYVVTGNYGHHVTAVYTMDMTNPDEFDLVQKAANTKEEVMLTTTRQYVNNEELHELEMLPEFIYVDPLRSTIICAYCDVENQSAMDTCSKCGAYLKSGYRFVGMKHSVSFYLRN